VSRRVIPIVLIAIPCAAVVALAVLAVFPVQRSPGTSPGPQSGAAATLGGTDRPLRGRTDTWVVSGQIATIDSHRFRLDMRVADLGDQSAPDSVRPTVTLSMAGHLMPPVAVPVRRVAPGTFVAEGEIPMSGQWRAYVRLPDGVVQFLLDIGR